jgi:hypothetical protein
MEWTKKYRWVRAWPAETGWDGKPLEDYCAYDGEEYAGRIRLETEGPMKGKWQWAGSFPSAMRGQPILPNLSYCSSAAVAARAVEIYWDASKARRLDTEATITGLSRREHPESD